MIRFSEFITEDLITFNGKAFPKFGNVVIMAGGAGSGKGLVKNLLLGIEGWIYDVDELKKMVVKSPALIARAASQFGVDLTKYDTSKAGQENVLSDPENVSVLHDIVKKLGIDDKRMAQRIAASAMAPDDRKPNLIFDVTLKDLNKLGELTRDLYKAGYKRENVHIVWVINSIEVALKQNETRERTVYPEILIHTHRGASTTMHEIVMMGQTLNRYMDGFIAFVFNKRGEDNEVVTVVDSNGNKVSSNIKKGTSNYYYVKTPGKPVNKTVFTDDVKKKLGRYVPASTSWDDL